MLTKSQVLDAIKKSLVLYKREILDSEYSTRKYVDDSISNINDLPLLSSICMKNEDGSLIKSGVNYLLDFSKIPVDDTKFYLDDVSSTGKVFSNTVLGFEKDGVVDTNLRFRLNSNFPIISLGYRTSDTGIYISNRYSTISYIIDSNERTVSELYSLSEKVSKSQVITISNKTEYTPTNDYNPATKKYVDERTFSREVVTVNNVNDSLTLTTDKNQYATLAVPVEIILPTVTSFTELHLFFSGSEGVTIGTTNVKWESQVTIENNKSYEIIFTYVNESIGWLGKTIVYS